MCTNTVTALFAAAVLTANLTETLRKKPKRFKGTGAHTALSHRLSRAATKYCAVRTIYWILVYIYIYAICRRFYPKRLILHSYTFYQFMHVEHCLLFKL